MTPSRQRGDSPVVLSTNGFNRPLRGRVHRMADSMKPMMSKLGVLMKTVATLLCRDPLTVALILMRASTCSVWPAAEPKVTMIFFLLAFNLTRTPGYTLFWSTAKRQSSCTQREEEAIEHKSNLSEIVTYI